MGIVKWRRGVWCAVLVVAVLPCARGAGGGAGEVPPQRWMAGLADAALVSRISIPGAHDAAARREPWPGTAACQNVGIRRMLEFGVRYLDIRCRHLDDGFAIYHGSADQEISFGEVLKQTGEFLEANPGECVLMVVKEEHAPKGNTRSFAETFAAFVARNPKRWWLGTRIPKLGEVRGKIVLVRRFASEKPMGIDATRWPDNAVFKAPGLGVQDRYVVKDTGAKWNAVEKALDAARAEKNPSILHLNHASGYRAGRFGIPDIPGVAKAINPKLAAYFAAAPPGRYGCVIMDHVTADLARRVFMTNFPG